MPPSAAAMTPASSLERANRLIIKLRTKLASREADYERAQRERCEWKQKFRDLQDEYGIRSSPQGSRSIQTRRATDEAQQHPSGGDSDEDSVAAMLDGSDDDKAPIVLDRDRDVKSNVEDNPVAEGPNPIIKQEPNDEDADALRAPISLGKFKRSCSPDTAEAVTIPQEFLNIAIKIKPEAATLSEESIQRRLRDAGATTSVHINFRTSLHGHAVTREELSSAFGGNSQATYSMIAKNTQTLLGHNHSLFLCANVLWGPDLPKQPGVPGLFYSSKEIEWPLENPVFVGLNTNMWLYMGHYKGIQSDPMSLEELGQISDVAKKVWYQDIGKMAWGKLLRGRIRFRKRHGRPAEPGELERKAKYDSDASFEEIETAFAAGQERMGVICLKPVRYDEDFQKEVIARCNAVRLKGKKNVTDREVIKIEDNNVGVGQGNQARGEGNRGLTRIKRGSKGNGSPATRKRKVQRWDSEDSGREEEVAIDDGDDEYVPPGKRKKVAQRDMSLEIF